jgi:hypothetical protein
MQPPPASDELPELLDPAPLLLLDPVAVPPLELLLDPPPPELLPLDPESESSFEGGFEGDEELLRHPPTTRPSAPIDKAVRANVRFKLAPRVSLMVG